MTTDVRVYQPTIKVSLHKTIKRETVDDGIKVSTRYRGIDQIIDLTDYLSDASGVRTSKSVREPAGGFSITLADKAYADKLKFSFETLYGLIEPMDYIEIRAKHGGKNLTGAGAPIIMRGFISEVQRSETMNADGRPMRTVTISGQDYGKIWQMLQLLFLPGYVIGQDTLSSFKLFERFGIGFETAMKGGKFVTDVIEKIVNPYLEKMIPDNSTYPSKIQLDVTSWHGTTSVSGPQNQQGTFYELLRYYCDVGIWNELFIEDRETGVFCVFRSNPYKDVKGDPIHSDAPTVDVIDLPDTDIISLNVSRSDNNVANFYWVRAARFDLVSDIYRKLFAIKGDKKTVLLTDYPNTAEKLYGVRVMQADTQMGGDEVKTFNSGQDAAGKQERDTSVSNWINDRRRLMVEQNKDNVVLEHGTMRIRGNERVRAGTFVKLRRGQFTAEYYVIQVSHDYIPFQGFFSTLAVERGMGFVERSKREGGAASPYLAELQKTL